MRCSLLTLSSYLDSELDGQRQGEVEAHLIGCRRCATGMEHLREELAHIGALGRISISHESAVDLLTQLGLLQPGQALPACPKGDGPSGGAAVGQAGPSSPPPSPTAPVAPARVLPPWLAGTSGPALPWRAEVPGRNTQTRSRVDDEAEAVIELSGHPVPVGNEVPTETSSAGFGGGSVAETHTEAAE